jgi:Zn-dependent membrane protease YugP
MLGWLWLAVLIAVPKFANLIAVTWARGVWSRHDWDNDDDLPQTAGEWVTERLATVDANAIVTDDASPGTSNAYHVNHGVIQLTHETYFKPDPVYWAIAAHELGHAHIHHRHPVAAWVLRRAKWLAKVLAWFGVGLAMGNALYALPGVTDLAFALLVTAAVLALAELVDEAWASRWAYRELCTSAHLTPRHLRAVRAALRAAFGTYAITYAAHAVLLTQWGLVERLTGEGRLGELGSLGVAGTILVIATLLVGALYAFVSLRITLGSVAFRRRAAELRKGFDVIAIVFQVLLLGSLALMWNLRGDTIWAWCVILAVVRVSSLVASLLALPGLPVLLFGKVLAKHLDGPGLERSTVYERALASGRGLIKQGNERAKFLAFERTQVSPTLAHRLSELLQLLYVPLFVVYLLG